MAVRLLTRIATCGVRYTGCTREAAGKNRRLAAIAKHTRDEAITPATLHPKVEITTLPATSAAPTGPTSADTARSAMRVTPDISSMDSE